jgi:hypothetical protein
VRPIALLLSLLVVACSAARKQAQPLTMEEQIVQEILPIVTLQPSLWESTGSDIAPTLLLGGHAVRDYEFEFTYEGSGKVRTSENVVVAKGANELVVAGFSCEPVEEACEGVVRVSVLTVDGEHVQVAAWPVLHRPSIVDGLEVISTEVVSEDDMYACLVAVQLDPLEESFGRASVPERDLQFEAWVDKQGGYAPRVRVTQHVERDDFPNLSRDFEFDGNRLVVLVCVERSNVPPRRRAYLTLQATIAGDTHSKNVPLPTR